MISLLVIFRDFCFRPPDPKHEKKSVNQQIQNSGLIILIYSQICLRGPTVIVYAL